jgi:2-polyprenyl-6-methoxyphenol hydroxylase-like FAD-dependent oxidoreductase
MATMGNGRRICFTARRGSTLAILILAFQALSADLAVILIGTAAVAISFHIGQGATASLREEIILLLREEEDLRRQIEVALYRTPRRLEVTWPPPREMS